MLDVFLYINIILILHFDQVKLNNTPVLGKVMKSQHSLIQLNIHHKDNKLNNIFKSINLVYLHKELYMYISSSFYFKIFRNPA